MGRLDGKVAIISGGANGMGRSECSIFAQEGAKVVIGDIRTEDGQAVEATIKQAGGDAMFVHLDVTSEESWQAAVDQAVGPVRQAERPGEQRGYQRLFPGRPDGHRGLGQHHERQTPRECSWAQKPPSPTDDRGRRRLHS